MSKWRDNKKMEREWENGERFTLYISSFSLLFLPLYPFPISKIVSFCRKMLNTALLSRISQKNLSYALWENNSWSNSLRESSVVPACILPLFTFVYIFIFYILSSIDIFSTKWRQSILTFLHHVHWTDSRSFSNLKVKDPTYSTGQTFLAQNMIQSQML